jgi:deoxyribodipyrimidine photo-lyase
MSDVEGMQPEHSARARRIRHREYHGGPIVLWMNRDQRAKDNWALLFAAEMANLHQTSLWVTFCLVPGRMGPTLRQYDFMVKGLEELEPRLRSLGMRFALLEGKPEVKLSEFLHNIKAGMLIMDFDPLRNAREWKVKVIASLDIPVYEVDAHNIVPCWRVSRRRIMSSATFKARITPMLQEWLTEYPLIPKLDHAWTDAGPASDWKGALERIGADPTVKPVDWLRSGEEAAHESLRSFVQERLSSYHSKAMDPTAHAQSDLSPYLHLGQLSPQRVALEIVRSGAPDDSKKGYIDRLVVLRELADNFCLHTPWYDTLGAFPPWARKSINEHRDDEREHLYSREQLEVAGTHDNLWNATQTELVRIGKIRGALREYWALKILEWTPSPEEALDTAIYLNDRYGMDGRDPSGYTGIAMVIGGLYGKPWVSKEVIGKIKSMTYTGERLRYDIHAYLNYVKGL